MDRSSRRQNEARGQRTGRVDEGHKDRRESRRSQSPTNRRSHDYRNDGGRWPENKSRDATGSTTADFKPPTGPRSNQTARKEVLQSSIERSSNDERRSRDHTKHNGARETKDPPNASSMPFVRNDKPYKYEFKKDKSDFTLAQDTEDFPDDATLRQMMGFAQFRTSHELKIPGNHLNYAVLKVKQTEYRQYMNRRNGFNRPLSPPRN